MNTESGKINDRFRLSYERPDQQSGGTTTTNGGTTTTDGGTTTTDGGTTSQSGKLSGSDIAEIIKTGGNNLADIISAIFKKPDTNNTYLVGGGSGEKSNTGLYIGIGAGVLVLVLVLVLALRK